MHLEKRLAGGFRGVALGRTEAGGRYSPPQAPIRGMTGTAPQAVCVVPSIYELDKPDLSRHLIILKIDQRRAGAISLGNKRLTAEPRI
jgi:hypothetical protein